MPPSFLHRLGLDNSADERAIRRAYARELKQIDQEADPAGFQSLREAYEAALQWLQWRDETDPDDLPVPLEVATHSAPASTSYAPQKIVPQFAPATPDPAPAAPDMEEQAATDAAAVFAEFVYAFRTPDSSGARNLDDRHWEKILQQCLADSRLISIAARESFELRLAYLLSNGWQPGHEVLLVVAARVFGWANERRRLSGLGYAGNILDLALQERAVFDNQAITDAHMADIALIQRLRIPAPPSHGELLKKMGALERLVARYPTWLRLITDMSQLQRWRALDQEVPAWRRKLNFRIRLVKPQAAAQPPAKSSFSWSWGAAFFLIVVINMARIGFSESTPPPKSIAISPEVQKIMDSLNKQGASRAPLPPLPPDPRGGRPYPPAVPKKTLAALVKKAPTAETCNAVAQMAYDYGVGTDQQDAELGGAFDRQVIACVAKKQWPRSVAGDPALRLALDRAKSQPVMDAQAWKANLPKIHLDPLPPPTPFMKPVIPRDTGSDKYRLDYKDPLLTTRPGGDQ